MINREAIEAMMTNMDTDTLLKALSAVGVQIGDAGEGGGDMMDDLCCVNEMGETWQDTKVPVGESPMRRMALHSPEMYAAAKADQRQAVRQSPNPLLMANETPPGEEDYGYAAR